MNSILYWNAVSLDANKVSHSNGKGEQTGPTLSSRAFAIVHLAMYDAYAGVVNTPASFPLYLSGLTLPPAGSSVSAAVAAAAHATLSALFPSQKSFFDRKHLEAPIAGPKIQEGHLFGLQVACKLLDERKDDPGAGDNGYASSMKKGAHRPDPDNPSQGYHAPFYGKKCKCFSSARFALDVPPQPGSSAYKKALKEVREKGIVPELAGTIPNARQRTAEETLIGLYWGYDGAIDLGTPPRLYNQIVLEVAKEQGTTADAQQGELIRLLTFVNVAMGDAGILAWEQKYKHDLWRPVVGVREADNSMGPLGQADNNFDADCDPNWLPLGAPSSNSNTAANQTSDTYPCQHKRTAVVKNFTPPFPAYPSGHATFGAAALHIARLFYGVAVGNRKKDTLLTGTFVSEEYNGITQDNRGVVRPKHARKFKDGLWQMIEENGRSRIYLGVHWLFDAFAIDTNDKPDLSKNIGGVPLGLNIAEDIFTKGNKKAPKKINDPAPGCNG
jgi:Vanadium chloroperoxidase N-terminal domain